MEAERLSHHTLPPACRNHRAIIGRMFNKRMCFLHMALAFSGINKEGPYLKTRSSCHCGNLLFLYLGLFETEPNHFM
ncbi:hypothetical protein SAMN05421868_114113 [Paenibacillus naphthalenovorans]|nr:hypothetical protein SAMN05421868_114113 [Paenibacillus naphthalenovorans]